MELIREGLEAGIDVSVYADPDFSAWQMEQIREGLEAGVDARIYADPQYHWAEMKQIRLGLESGLDVSAYADPNFIAFQMEQIREGLEAGVDVSWYADPQFSQGQMRVIKESLENGYDVSIIANPEYSEYAMEEIILGIDSGVDISIYADPKFDGNQMEQIREGLEAGLDVSIYADTKYNSYVMEAIKECLMNGTDYSVFLKLQGPECKDIDYQDVAAIKKGLEAGLDVSLYADPKYHSYAFNHMDLIRRGLEAGIDKKLLLDPNLSYNDLYNMVEGRNSTQNKKAKSTTKIKTKGNSKWGKVYPVTEVFPYDLDEYPPEEYSDEDLIDVMESNGHAYFPTLGEACEFLYEDSDGDIDEILQRIDYGEGNSEGVMPLSAQGDWTKQQSIMLEFIKKFHPEAFDDPNNAEYADS